MAYEWIPTILFGILFIVISRFIQGSAPIYGLSRLGLLFGGLILIGWGIFTGWAELTAGI